MTMEKATGSNPKTVDAVPIEDSSSKDVVDPVPTLDVEGGSDTANIDVEGAVAKEEEEDVCSGDSDVTIDYTDWDYVDDPSFEEMPFTASQPCFNIRGVSYTPPGWMRKYKYRKRTRSASANEEECKPPAAKRIDLEK